MPDTIRLDPDLFMALGLSAEAHGGLGAVSCFYHDNPWCALGHAKFLDDDDSTNALGWSRLQQHLLRSGFQPCSADDRIRNAGRDNLATHRIPFEEWCRIVGVDCA